MLFPTIGSTTTTTTPSHKSSSTAKSSQSFKPLVVCLFITQLMIVQVPKVVSLSGSSEHSESGKSFPLQQQQLAHQDSNDVAPDDKLNHHHHHQPQQSNRVALIKDKSKQQQQQSSIKVGDKLIDPALDSERKVEVVGGAKKAQRKLASAENTKQLIDQHQQQSNGTTKQQQQQLQFQCDYEKGPWNECNSDGIQQRTLKLKSSPTTSHLAKLANDSLAKFGKICEPIKLVRRDCKPAGCKYKRGEWSASCRDGERSRVDSLVAELGNATACKPERRVTKDCRRTCHYIKSAWSDCANGFRTRDLTLDESATGQAPGGGGVHETGHAPAGRSVVSLAPAGRQCAKQRQVRRPCRQAPATPKSGQAPPGGRPQTMTASQRRRLKQQQLQMQAKQQQSSGSQTTTTAATTTTTTTTTATAGPRPKRSAG